MREETPKAWGGTHSDGMTQGRPTVFFDIDGTLAWRDPEQAASLSAQERDWSPAPTPVVAEAVRSLVERGGLAFLCTGRSPAAIHPILAGLPFTGFVTLSGAYASMGGEVLRDVALPLEVLMLIEGALAKRGAGALVEGVGGVSELRGGPEGTSEGGHSTMQGALRDLGGNAYKLVMRTWMAQEVLALPALGGMLKGSDLGDENTELGLAANTKQVGMNLVLRRLGSRVGTTYAFGDSKNDLSSFAVVDVPVAVGNASPEIKDRAALVTAPVWEDGVARGLVDLGLADPAVLV